MSMRTSPAKWLAALCVAAAIAAGSWQSQRRAKRAAHDAATTQIETERVLAYEVRPTQPLRVRLPDETGLVVRINATAQLAAALTDAETVLWGYRVQLQRDGTTRWSQVVHFESRVTTVRTPSGSLIAATTALDDARFSDFRDVTLQLPPAAAGAVLTLEPVAAPGLVTQSAARIFLARQRDTARQSQIVGQLEEAELYRLVRNAGGFPVSFFDLAALSRRVATRWVRLPPVGDAGRDYAPRPLTIAELPRPTQTKPPTTLRIAAQHEKALTTRGPGLLTLQHLSGPPHARFTLIAANGETTSWEGPIDGVVALPAGWVTLRVAPATSSEPARTEAHARNAALPTLAAETITEFRVWQRAMLAPGWLQVAGSQANGGVDGGQWLSPRHVMVPLAWCDPTHPVRVMQFPLRDRMRRTLRLDARIPLEAAPVLEPTQASRPSEAPTELSERPVSRVVLPPTPARAASATPANLTVHFFDRAGASLGVVTPALRPARSEFELMQHLGSYYATTDAVSMRVLPPDQATAVEVRCGTPVALRLARYVGMTPAYADPSQAVLAETLEWKFAELAQQRWQPLVVPDPEPAAHALLLAQERLTERDLETRRDDDAPRPLDVRLFGDAEQQRIRETVAATHAAAAWTEWPTGMITPMRLGHAVELDFRDKLAGRPRVYYRAPAGALGELLRVRIGDAAPEEFPITTTAGAFDLATDSVATRGRHAVQLSAPSGVRAWLDRPPALFEADLQRIRTVWRLGRNPIRARVTRHAHEHVVVFAIIYTPTPEADLQPRLRVTIDGGAPRVGQGTVTATITATDRKLALPAARSRLPAEFVDKAQSQAGYAHLVAIGLGADLPAGGHEIAFYGPANQVWWLRVVAQATDADNRLAPLPLIQAAAPPPQPPTPPPF